VFKVTRAVAARTKNHKGHRYKSANLQCDRRN